VENEAILAMDIVAEIEDHNGVVLGPVMTLEQGILALRDEKPDACIVNINLGPEKVYELADLLIDQDVRCFRQQRIPCCDFLSLPRIAAAYQAHDAS